MSLSRTPFVFAALTVGLGLHPGPARSADVIQSGDRVVPNERVTESVALRDVTVDGGIVSGVLTNTSGKALRDVQLLIRYDWLWRNEFRPGEDNPSRAVYYTVPGDIPPGGQTKFTYRADPPLPERSDGHFNTSVKVAGFVEVSGALP
jgi:hypothetical protein